MPIRDCHAHVQPVQYLKSELEERNSVFKEVSSRAKRAPLEFMGTLMSDLFGVLDQRDAIKYHQQIQDVVDGNLQMRALIQQQTHILDVTVNLLKKRNQEINEHYVTIKNDLNTLNYHWQFLSLILRVTTAMNIFRATQEAIIDVLSDVHHGRINTKLITPTQLEQQLRDLQQLIPSTTRIPTYQNHWMQTYKIMNMKAGIVKDQVIFKLTLPLLQRDEYHVYNIIPVPTLQEDRFIYIEPTFSHVLVNPQRSWYYPITNHELNACLTWENQAVICKQLQPLHNLQSDEAQCEMAILNHEHTPPVGCQIKSMIPTTYLTHLHQTNSWIMVMAHETSLDVICGDQIKPVILKGAGILMLRPGCALRGKAMLINSHTNYRAVEHISFLPNFNLSTQIKLPNTSIISATYDSDLQALEQAIHKLKTEEPWTHMNHHHIHQYGVTSLLIITMIAVAIIWLRRQWIQRKIQQLREIPIRDTEVKDSSTPKTRQSI